MTTGLTTKEFESRLKELTRDGEPLVMGTPFCILTFNFGQEPFYGKIENSKFRLTNNSSFNPTGTIVEGSYEQTENEGTKVEYQIKTMTFPYFWIRFVPVFGLIVFNSIIIFNSDTIHLTPILAVTVFIGLMFLLGIWGEKRRFRKMEKRFVQEFEIEKH